MSILSKAKRVRKIMREHGLGKIGSILISKFKLSFFRSSKSKWKTGIKSEIEFWDAYFSTKGLQWADSYETRFNPDFPLQPRPASLLPSQFKIHILDVGAGPLTFLGKK